MGFDKQYYLNQLKRLDSSKTYVLSGHSVFSYRGMSCSGSYMPFLYTENKMLDGVTFNPFVSYWYTDNQDVSNYVELLKGTNNIYLPTIERAIIEALRNDLRCTIEDYFYDDFSRYIEFDMDYKKLCEVADFYGLSREKLDYYINEAKDYNSY